MGIQAPWFRAAAATAFLLVAAGCAAPPSAGAAEGMDIPVDIPAVVPPAQPESRDFLVTVEADWGWQPSGIAVRRGDLVEITYVEGTWNGDGGQNPAHGPDGPVQNAVPAHANYPLPGKMEDSLIGRIGEDVFFVGSHASHVAEVDGEVDFTINDTGHSDNQGLVTVRVGVFTRATAR